MSPRHSDDDDEPRELSRAEAPFDVVGDEASLARLVEQSNREAAASRAQARELIKALEGVQRSQEYLGTALREERRRSRWLTALLALAPLVAGVGAWLVWRRVDSVRGDVDRRLEKMQADGRTARADDAAKLRDVRVSELAGDVETLRRDLDASRDALAAERRHLAEREAVLSATESRGESAKSEIAGLEQEVKAARAKANAEQQRAIQLEDRLTDARKELAAKAAPPPPVETKPTETKPAVAVEPPKPPANPAEAEKTRVALNALLAQSGDAVRYRFESIGGVAGRALSDVLVVGADDSGAVVRSIQAAHAQITIDAGTGSVVVRFADGKLIVGAKQAPFFDGTYGLVVRGDPEKWKASGLAAESGD